MDAKPRSTVARPARPTLAERLAKLAPGEFLPDEILLVEILLVDGSVLRPRPWRRARQAEQPQSKDKLPLRLSIVRLWSVGRGAEPTPEVAFPMHAPQLALTAPEDETALFRPHFENGLWHWTYHNARGRLLARGAEQADRCAAHRALLEAIADYCTSGEAADDEDDSPPPADEEPPFAWP